MASPGCPLGGVRKMNASEEMSRPLHETNRDATTAAAKLPTGRARIRLLYEEYVHLPLLRQVWHSPSTEKPVLEPLFAAGFHGIELDFLLLAEFISDSRGYVSKRPRVELVADDIAAQCRLLTEVVDAELEEELAEGGDGCGYATAGTASRLSLTQAFPFDGCPPTKAEPCHSPGLQRLTEAIRAKLSDMSSAERNSVIKLVINITAAFGSFQRWTVGLGIEHQLQDLQAAVGLQPTQYPHRLNLDYAALVRPWLCLQTLTCEQYIYSEDFFFRTIHLGTDCWAFVALARMAGARQLAEAGNWHAAAARATQAARILDFMGQHVLLLTSMNLRDYLLLKVELEGTSGEGSAQVKSLRATVAGLFAPLEAALLRANPILSSTDDNDNPGNLSASAYASDARQGPLQEALMCVYEWPDRQPGLYNYCKALEALETGLLGGFFFKHYCLATNVIGTEARGTMRRAVAALKAGYETLVFPLLDRCRVALGARLDAELADRKGRMMQNILNKAVQKGQDQSQQSAQGQFSQARPAAAAFPAAERSSCPFGHSRAALPAQPTSSMPSALPTPVPAEHGVEQSSVAVDAGSLESGLQALYSWAAVPPSWRHEVAAEQVQQAASLGLVVGGSTHCGPSAGKPLAFLDHAWGQMAPLAQYRSWREAAALSQLGNPAWHALFGRVMPQAAANVKTLLGLPADSAACAVHFGSNTHELVGRLLSTFLDRGAHSVAAERGMRQGSSEGGGRQLCMRVLTSDAEFYSINRQLARFVEAGVAEVEAVPAEPVATFPDRCCAAVAAAAAAGQPFDAAYLSQTTYLTQQTLIPDVAALVRGLKAASGTAPPPAAYGSCTTPAESAGAGHSKAAAGQPAEVSQELLVIVDSYHGFCALPTDLSAVAEECVYVAGLLKHAGCGANCAFLTLPARLAARPLLTGWLADPVVLSPDSSVEQMSRAEVAYSPALALQGGTPSYMLPLLTFNHLMQLWREACAPITVEGLHFHVMHLHRRFLEGLDAVGHPTINRYTLLPPQDQAHRSHTLVFRHADVAAAKAAVAGLAAQGVLIDKRQQHVRVGFGPNHSAADVDALLAALRMAGSLCIP